MTHRVVFAALLLSTGLIVRAPTLHAQAVGNGTVAGRVTDAQSGGPLESVTITVEGTQLGAVTGPDGTYRITRVPNGAHAIAARRIGYNAGTRTVHATGTEAALADARRRTMADPVFRQPVPMEQRS